MLLQIADLQDIGLDVARYFFITPHNLWKNRHIYKRIRQKAIISDEVLKVLVDGIVSQV